MCVHEMVHSLGKSRRRITDAPEAKTNDDQHFPQSRGDVSQGTGLVKTEIFHFSPILNSQEGWLISSFTFEGFVFHL